MDKKGIAQLVILLIVGSIIGGTWFLSYNDLIPSISTGAIKESCKKNCEDVDHFCEKDCEAHQMPAKISLHAKKQKKLAEMHANLV